MFTDGPTTPLRVETLLTLVREMGRRAQRDTLRAVFQPQGLDRKGNSSAFDQTFRAAEELKLIQVKEGQASAVPEKTIPIRVALQEALDREVLAHTGVEPYFALFYAFVLGTPRSSMSGRTRDDWVAEFNRVLFEGESVSNRFNPDKLSGLHRWLRYAGLGWYDSKDSFQCLPVPRLLRCLERIFQKERRMMGEAFMAAVARECPELDGGEVFLRANPPWDPAQKQCTAGFAQALVALHEDGWIRLHGAPDSRGWSLALAEPPNDGKTLRSVYLDEVELVRSTREDR